MGSEAASTSACLVSAADIACIDPLDGNDLCPLLQQFGMAISRARFDDARALIESFRGTRVPISASAEDSLCHLLLSACIQIVKAESAYYSLNFMVPKAFFRRESTLLLTYTQIKAELCRMDDVMGNTTISTAEDIRRRLIDFTSARVSMINVYNSFLVENFGLPNELTALTTVLSSVEHLLMLLINHESLTSLFTFIVNEIVTMKLLLEVQLALIRCESLIKLKSAHVRLRLWFSSVGYKHAQNKGTVKFFSFGSQVQCSSLRLCSWTYEFYILLLAKFSLYFHDSLQPQCSIGDFDHTINAMKSPNFIQIFSSFQRRMEPLSILLIADRCNAPDISPLIGYGCAADLNAGEGELRKKFLIFLKIGGGAKEVNVLLPSISILIQEAATKKFGTDRITYCHDQLISKSFFVLPVEYNLYITVIFNRRVSERDNTVVSFLLNSCNQLRCVKICQSWRKFSTDYIMNGSLICYYD
ncbi:KICSTOR subunit [Dirofilaria immitis]